MPTRLVFANLHGDKMESFSSTQGRVILDELISTIQNNKQYLSDIDGAIGDGDHGINMNKGFTLCQQELANNPGDLSQCFNTLSKILMTKIGGSMGPLYGMFFRSMAKACTGAEQIDAKNFGLMLQASLDGINSISQAKVGDKTLMDTLVPAVGAYQQAVTEGKTFTDALAAMKQAAVVGRDSTKDLLAKVGRSSRLGERSRGTIDAGAASCCLILCGMAEAAKKLIK